MSDGMSRYERDELAKLIRRREAIAKQGAKQRAAELTADVEEQLTQTFKIEDERWKEAIDAARVAIDRANAEIATRCHEVGVPAEFRPKIGTYWLDRGENGYKERRGELRKVAMTRIAALEQAARTAIETYSIETQTRLLSGGLDSTAARDFLEAMPPVETLMPALDVQTLPMLAAGGTR